VPSLGDEAEVVVERTGSVGQATVQVRTGVLCGEVIYGAPYMDDTELRSTATVVAGELLRRLPPKGR